MEKEENKEVCGREQQKPKIQRRTIFIKKDMQIRMIALVLVSVLMGIAIMSYEFISYAHTLFENNPSLLEPFFQNLGPMAMNIGLKLLAYLVLIAILSSVISHKVAGPIYRFEQTCKDIACGNIKKRVNLRKGDMFMDLQDEFNSMMNYLEGEIEKNDEKKKE
ncbi:hypothetical protein Dip518_001336 [Parelusimicrobium proximum]|uniref:HAMP domain-containing protein n=1 Tax=Parelusimicrobium proximum TaxID=3228953 RepID=UPI003D16DFAE